MNTLDRFDADDIFLAARVLWPLCRTDIEPCSSERFGEVVLGIGDIPHFRIPLVKPPDTPAGIRRFARLPHQEGAVVGIKRQELTARPQDAEGFADDIIGPVDGKLRGTGFGR